MPTIAQEAVTAPSSRTALDEILAAFEHACELGDAPIATRLLAILAGMLSRSRVDGQKEVGRLQIEIERAN
jgi:hypothetical protein